MCVAILSILRHSCMMGGGREGGGVNWKRNQREAGSETNRRARRHVDMEDPSSVPSMHLGAFIPATAASVHCQHLMHRHQ